MSATTEERDAQLEQMRLDDLRVEQALPWREAAAIAFVVLVLLLRSTLGG